MDSVDHPIEKGKPLARTAIGQIAYWQFNLTRARALLESMDGTCPGGDQEWKPDRLDMLLSAVRIVDVNDEAIRLFGLPQDRDKILDRSTASLWPEQSRAALGDLLTTIAGSAHKGAVTREIPTVGRLQHVVLTGWKAFDPRCADTVFVSVRATLNTPNAVVELEASQKRYRNMISSLPIPVWQIDARPAGRILTASELTASMTSPHIRMNIRKSSNLQARLYKSSTSTRKPWSFSAGNIAQNSSGR